MSDADQPVDHPVSRSDAVDAVDAVDADDRARVLAIADAAHSVDGSPALDDQVRLDLKHPSPHAAHLLARDDADRIVGYAHLRVDPADGSSAAHVVVDPGFRRRGVGRSLVRALAHDLEDRGGTALRIWAHGDGEAARGLAERLGFTRGRVLRKMIGDLTAMGGVTAPEPPPYPDGVGVRTFVVGEDEDAWLALNAAAFAGHPEQGRMTRADLDQRIDEDWFDPAGFFLAARGGELLGFHWTKVHPSGASDGGPIGEIYVIGIAPAAQGSGLGSALTKEGLRYLHRERGLREAELYVEDDNLAAVRLYERTGFETSTVDVMYEQGIGHLRAAEQWHDESHV